MKGTFLTDLRARLILGGLFGAAFGAFNKISVFSMITGYFGPFGLGLAVVLLIIAMTLVKTWRDPEKRISKIVRFFIPQMGTWYSDLTVVCMYLAGVNLGALLIDLVLRVLGFERDILQFLVSACIFLAASAVLHRYSSKLNKETGPES